MSSFDDAGRIRKQTFLVSTTVLFSAVLFALFARLYIRLRVQKEFSIDDGLIVFGVLLLIAAMGMLYFFVDMMFTAEALLLHHEGAKLDFQLIQDSFAFQKWAAVSLTTTWVAINTVKLSFLFLFRRLINRMRSMVIYWWCVLVYTIIVGLWGVSAYIAPCPTFYDFAALTCCRGPGVQLILRYSISQMALDMLGDIFSKTEFRIIRWTQKIALSFSLCLSVAMIAVTLTRASGLVAGNSIDATWATYWQYLSAEVGLLMSTATAFRTFFVSCSVRLHEAKSPAIWYTNLLRRLKSLVSPIRTKSRKQVTPLSSSDGFSERTEGMGGLPQIPRPTMTGLHTFIGRNGKSPSEFMGSQSPTPSQILLSRSVDLEVEEGWPISNYA